MEAFLHERKICSMNNARAALCALMRGTIFSNSREGIHNWHVPINNNDKSQDSQISSIYICIRKCECGVGRRWGKDACTRLAPMHLSVLIKEHGGDAIAISMTSKFRVRCRVAEKRD